MALFSYSRKSAIAAGQPNTASDVVTSFDEVGAQVNGNIDDTNVATANKDGLTTLASMRTLGPGATQAAAGNHTHAGLFQSAGYSNIATEESRTNTAYGTLTTPDQVASVVLPANGLIGIAYQAMWKESVNASAQAAIFIGSNQLKRADASSAAPVAVGTALIAGSANVYKPIATYGLGLDGTAVGTTVYTGDVTTGQVVGSVTGGAYGGPCYVHAAAGTYTVSVKFKASSGSVTAKERKLWVWVQAFS